MSSQLPDVPALGEENTHYGKIAHKAEKEGDVHKVSAYKVAQYITLAHEAEEWPKKLKYYAYALDKHAAPKPPIDDAVWEYYQMLQDWVRRECGSDALRLARAEDEFLKTRTELNELRFKLVSEAAQFFRPIVPTECPNHFRPEDYEELRKIQFRWA